MSLSIAKEGSAQQMILWSKGYMSCLQQLIFSNTDVVSTSVHIIVYTISFKVCINTCIIAHYGKNAYFTIKAAVDAEIIKQCPCLNKVQHILLSQTVVRIPIPVSTF